MSEEGYYKMKECLQFFLKNTLITKNENNFGNKLSGI